MMTMSGVPAEVPISVTLCRPPASSPALSASTETNPSAWENDVTAPEPLSIGNATPPFPPGYQRHQHEFLAAELRWDGDRHGRFHGLGRLWQQPGAGANDGRDEAVKGEDRRGREARQPRDRLF